MPSSIKCAYIQSDSDYESELSDQEIIDNSESEVEVESNSKSLYDRFEKAIEQYRELAELMISVSSKFSSKETSEDEIDMSDSIVTLFSEDNIS